MVNFYFSRRYSSDDSISCQIHKDSVYDFIILLNEKDSVFNDCHVINMFFSEDLYKWIWIDPTNDAYIMDEKGNLLGLSKIRERLINDKTLIVNPDAN